jgi:hypothetical protein
MSDMTDLELRRLAERRVDAKAGFWIHAAIFATVNAAMVLAHTNRAPGNPWFLWCAGSWALALLVQGIVVYAPARALRSRAIEAELARLRQARA